MDANLNSASKYYRISNIITVKTNYLQTCWWLVNISKYYCYSDILIVINSIRIRKGKLTFLAYPVHMILLQKKE